MKWLRSSKLCAINQRADTTGKIPVRILRKMGYKADNRGIMDRFIRMNGAWEGHLQNTRAFILKCVTGRRIENLAVYGSGWCLDLPLDELSEIAGNIQLYDLVHPPQVIQRIRRYRNIRVIYADISGGAVIRAYQAAKGYRKDGHKVSPEQICSQTFVPYVSPGFTISLNIMSQIGVMITDYLKEHVPYGSDELDHIAYLVQQSHIQLLKPGKSCLITDFRELNYDLNGQLTETIEVMLHPLPLSEHTETWEWQFDQLGGYKVERKTVFQIMALEF